MIELHHQNEEDENEIGPVFRNAREESYSEKGSTDNEESSNDDERFARNNTGIQRFSTITA